MIHEEVAADPERASHLRVIHEEVAAIVVRIFRWYDEGVSLVEIARRLNAEGVPAPLESTKRRNVERGWRSAGVKAILRNERYIGRFMWGRKGGGRKGRRVERPESQRVVSEDASLAIVDRALWDRVQARLAAARKGGRPPGSGARKVYLTTGLPRCGACGSPMSIGSMSKGKYASHQCSRARVRGTCANRAMIAERRLSAALLEALRSVLTQPEIADSIATHFERLARATSEVPGQVADAEARLKEAQGRLANVTRMIARRPDSEALLDQLDQEEAAIRAARAAVQAAREAAGAPRIAPSRAAVRASVGSFVESLGTLAPERANAVLRDAFGPAGITCSPGKLAWDCAGSLRIGGVLSNSESRLRSRWESRPTVARWWRR